jgi:hypothetical protein
MFLGIRELVVLGITGLLSASQDVDLELGLHGATLILTFLGTFGFLFAGSFGMLRG